MSSGSKSLAAFRSLMSIFSEKGRFFVQISSRVFSTRYQVPPDNCSMKKDIFYSTLNILMHIFDILEW